MKHLEKYDSNPVPSWVNGVNWGSVNMDANSGLMFSRELEHIENRLFEAKYTQNKARGFFAQNFNIGNGSDSYSYDALASSGHFGLIKDYRKDFQSIDASCIERITSPIYSFGVNVPWTVQDIRAAQMTGTPLNDFLMRAARQAWEDKLDDIVFRGEEDSAMTGLINNPKIPDAPDAAAVWAGLSGVALYDEVMNFIDGMVETTNGIEVPTNLLLPIPQMRLLGRKTFNSAGGSQNVMGAIQDNANITIDSWHKLKGAGDNDEDMAVLYSKSDINQEIIIPQEFETFAPQIENMAFVVTTHARTGGLLVRYPNSMLRIKGI